ncbi:MAG: DUF4261 domain-containing protein [Planctomycetota bacterium]
MAEYLFTQGVSVLLDKPVALERVCEKLDVFFGRVVDEPPCENGALYVLESPEEDDVSEEIERPAYLIVVASEQPWPDELGDPEAEPEAFHDWSLGLYGPLAFPGCLQRAVERSWIVPDVSPQASQHTAHVRLLIGYPMVPPVGDPAKQDESDSDSDDIEMILDTREMIEEQYDPSEELRVLARAISTVLEIPASIAYFNPGGEVLKDSDSLRTLLNEAWVKDSVPIKAWMNVRLFEIEDDWTLMDTVGNGQVEIPDLEAVFKTDRYGSGDIEAMLRAWTHRMIEDVESDLTEGDTVDGPDGSTWTVMECHDGLADPPRQTIRLVPSDGDTPPETLLYRGEGPEDIDDGDIDIDDSDWDWMDGDADDEAPF